MKYEMIFGDAGLFDGAPDDAEYAGWFCQEIRWYMILNGKILFSDGGTWCTSDNPYLSADIAAMRRIIKEPKRWTMQDKLAGRLPEVGCLVATIPNFDCTVVGVDEERKNIAIQYESGKLDVVRVHCVSPIETPEEKAARLRSEWCAKAAKTLKNLEYNSTLTCIYDALLSGDLPVPVAPEQNK